MDRYEDAKVKGSDSTIKALPPSPPETEDNDSQATDDAVFPLPPPLKELDVLDIDKKTPDYHVPRDARLIRLTGVHPFNVEPPLSDLFNYGKDIFPLASGWS